MSISEDDRAVRAAKNQSLFRQINESVKELNEAFRLVSPVGEWICECANTECIETVEMTANDYEAIRAGGARFFVAPGTEHVWPDVERVSDRKKNYWIVEKIGDAATVARQEDPRGNTDG
jgi:hypothetical protein